MMGSAGAAAPRRTQREIFQELAAVCTSQGHPAIRAGCHSMQRLGRQLSMSSRPATVQTLHPSPDANHSDAQHAQPVG